VTHSVYARLPRQCKEVTPGTEEPLPFDSLEGEKIILETWTKMREAARATQMEGLSIQIMKGHVPERRSQAPGTGNGRETQRPPRNETSF